jgi:putative oxidoreductase
MRIAFIFAEEWTMWFRKLVQTPEDYLLTLVRITLGVIFFAHGSQKVLGWFGGNGFDGTMTAFTQGMGVPSFLALLAILAEFLGGIGLILGFLSRIAAFAIAVEMAVAVYLVHAPNGFFMNWQGTQKGEGFEYHLLAIAIAVLVTVRGAGAWSLDRLVEAWSTGGRTLHIHMEPHPSR